jgi:hypothetical protein
VAGVGIMLEWREREHELNDNATIDDPTTLDALRDCGLLKFFLCQNMRAQPLMLQKLVDMWDVDCQHFVVRDQVLNLEVEDIYFLTRLSHHGVTVFLVGARRGSVEKVDDYVAHYCHPGTQKSNNKLPIGKVQDLTLRTILFTIT